MRPIWRGPVRWHAVVGLLVLVVGTAGIAAATTGPSSPQRISASSLAAAGLPGALPDQPTIGTAPPPTSTTAASPTSTSASTSTSRPAPSTTKPSTTRPTVPVPTTAAAVANVPTTERFVPGPVATPRTNPSSWTFQDKGIDSHLRIEPAAPHVGDTVTITFGSTSSVATDFCCIEYLYVDGTPVFTQFAGPGPCPYAQATADRQVTYVVTHEGALGLQLQATRATMCTLPMDLTTSNLFAAGWVLPAA